MFKGGNSKEINDQPNRLNRFVEGTNIKGDIVTDSNIRIDGELVGNLSTTAKLVIGPKGKITGDVICQNADIEGTVSGTIVVDQVLLLKATAVFTGNIKTAKIGVENGAEFTGTCVMNDNNLDTLETKIPVAEESEMVY